MVYGHKWNKGWTPLEKEFKPKNATEEYHVNKKHELMFSISAELPGRKIRKFKHFRRKSC